MATHVALAGRVFLPTVVTAYELAFYVKAALEQLAQVPGVLAESEVEAYRSEEWASATVSVALANGDEFALTIDRLN